MMGIPCQNAKSGAGAWLTGWQAESGRTGREQTHRGPIMHSLITSLTILILASIAQGQVSDAVAGWDPFAKVAPAAP